MIKGIIFDVDGTLYHQKPVRIMMALNMMLYYLIHFWKIKELFIILKFRRIREKNTKQKYKDTLIQLSNNFKYDYKKILSAMSRELNDDTPIMDAISRKFNKRTDFKCLEIESFSR